MTATAQANFWLELGGYSGKSGAYFDIAELQAFAQAISEFPLPDRKRCKIASGFCSKDQRGRLEQEHLGIDVYILDGRGHIGVQVRTATELWQGMRADSQRTAKLEIVTTYEPLATFSQDLLALLKGAVREAVLEGETLN